MHFVKPTPPKTEDPSKKPDGSKVNGPKPNAPNRRRILDVNKNPVNKPGDGVTTTTAVPTGHCERSNYFMTK